MFVIISIFCILLVCMLMRVGEKVYFPGKFQNISIARPARPPARYIQYILTLTKIKVCTIPLVSYHTVREGGRERGGKSVTIVAEMFVDSFIPIFLSFIKWHRPDCAGFNSLDFCALMRRSAFILSSHTHNLVQNLNYTLPASTRFAQKAACSKQIIFSS